VRVGVLELVIAEVDCEPLRRLYTAHVNRHYASIVPQAVSSWCRELGHRTFYATYWGQADPKSLLPDDLDVVFLSSHTPASVLASALAVLYRRDGVLTVLGGPHAKAFPEDALRFFDVVVQDCDRTLVAELLRDRPRGVVLSSPRRLDDVPAVEARLPEIAIAHLPKGRATRTSFIPLLASLGCPYACDFCADWDTPYRLAPLDRLEADLRFVAQRFPLAKIPFHDPNFAVKFDRVLEVLERLDGPTRNPYVIQTSLSVLREDRLRRLRDTGCTFLAPGIESFGDYSQKASVRRGADPQDKLEQVVRSFELIQRFVPGLQANFLLGVDCDTGPEPVARLCEFMDRLPQVWPNFNVMTPFGGTPLYEQSLASGRILRAMPFAFYYTPYLVTTLREQSAEEFYARAIDLFAHLTAARSVTRRARALSGLYQLFHVFRLLNARRLLREFRSLRALLRSDARFRAFHDGRSDELPPFYADRLRGTLGRYAELLPPQALRPRHAPASRRAPLAIPREHAAQSGAFAQQGV